MASSSRQEILCELKLLYSHVITRCLPEIIAAMPLEHLVPKIHMVKHAITMELHRMNFLEGYMIFDFMARVLQIRTDVSGLFGDIIPAVVTAMVEAERAERKLIWIRASKVLFYLARDYMEDTIDELVTTVQDSRYSSSLSIFTTLTAIMAYPTLPFLRKVYLLAQISDDMVARSHPGTQKVLSMFINNAAVALRGDSMKEPNIKLMFTKACTLLTNWAEQNVDCAEVQAVLTTTIRQVSALLTGLTPPSIDVSHAGQDKAQLIIYGPEEFYPKDPPADVYNEYLLNGFVKDITKTRKWREMLVLFSPLCDSYDVYTKHASVTICAALLSFPLSLPPDQHKGILYNILNAMGGVNIDVRQKVLEFLKYYIKTYPKMTIAFRPVLSETLVRELRKTENRTLVPAILKTLLDIVELDKRKAWKKHSDILSHVASYLYYKNPDTQLYATKLFGELVHQCRRLPYSTISSVIKEHCGALLVKLHSRESSVASAAAVSISQCLPHLGCRRITLEEGSEWRDTRYVDAIYLALAKKHLLKAMLIKTVKDLPRYADTEAVAKHLTAMKDFISYEELAQNDMRDLWRYLRMGHVSVSASVREAAQIASQSLGEKWKCLATAAVF